MKNSVVELIERALVRFNNFHQTKPQFFPDQDNLYPIPFFGDIRHATVLTLALNPAWTEFRRGGGHERHWTPGLDACALTTRLLHYFDLPTPPPHRWFKDRRDSLAMLDCSYETNTAHIDLHPLPTKFRQDLTGQQCNAIGEFIEARSKSHLSELLRLTTKARLLLVVDYTFSMSDGITTKTFDFISTHQPIVDLLRSYRDRLRVFSAGGANEFAGRIRTQRDALRRHLQM